MTRGPRYPALPHTLKTLPKALKVLPTVCKVVAEQCKVLPKALKTLPTLCKVIAEQCKVLPRAHKVVAETLEVLPKARKVLPKGCKVVAEGERGRTEIIRLYSGLHSPSSTNFVAQPKRFRPLFNCRFDELAPLARLLRASYVRDQQDFADLLPDDYTAAFLTDYDLHLQAVEKLVDTSVQIAKGMMLTQKVQEAYDDLPALLNRLEARVRRAENLTVPAKKFGIEDARQARAQQDREALAGDLNTLLQNITANTAALVKKGQKPAETAQIQALYDALVLKPPPTAPARAPSASSPRTTPWPCVPSPSPCSTCSPTARPSMPAPTKPSSPITPTSSC